MNAKPIALMWVLWVAGVAGCGSGVPAAPPEMNLDEARATIERNAQMEIEHIQGDSELSDAEKEKRIADVRRGSEGQLKVYTEAKTARDEAYPPGP